MSRPRSNDLAAASSAPALKRPRHFHEGPDRDEPAVALPAAAEVDSTPSLHRHALESVFAFLSLRELHGALSVSRSWCAAVGTLRPISAELSVEEPTDLSEVCASRLARHIGILELDVFTRLSLHLVAVSLPNLHTLILCGFVRLDGSHFVFPPKLTALNTRITDASAGEVNALLVALSRLPLLRSLRLTLRLVSTPALVTFAPLQAARRLDTLGVEWLNSDYMPVQPSGAQVDELRGLPNLVTMVMPLKTDAAFMRRLLRQPHSLKWQSFGEHATVKVELCALLPTLLPSLTALRCDLNDASDASFLTQLPNLLHLTLMCFGLEERLEQQLPALQRCSQLTKLTLWGCSFSAAHMSELLPCLPQLHELTLLEMPKLDSLRFLSRGPIMRTLTHLTLSKCGRSSLHSTELQHVHALKELRSLVIDQSFAEPLCPALLLFYSQPYSTLLPKLTQLPL